MTQDFVPEGHEAKYCTNCGARIDKKAVICPGCGVRQFSGLNTIWETYQSGGSAPNTKEDWDALHFIEIGSIAIIIGVILGLFLRLLLPISLVSTRFNLSEGALRFTGFFSILTLIPALAFICYANVNYRRSFSIYNKNERGAFSTPLTLTSLLYVGVGLVVFAIFLLIFMNQSINPQNAIIVIALIPLILGVILIIIGYIGIFLGLWKIGMKFNDLLMQVGAILFIIPYITVIGAILVYVSVKTKRNNINFTT